MANKKNFNTPAEAFFTKTEEKPASKSINDIEIPAGYKLVKEGKSARMQLLVTPTISSGLKSAAAVQGISLNELCNKIFEEYLNLES